MSDDSLNEISKEPDTFDGITNKPLHDSLTVLRSQLGHQVELARPRGLLLSICNLTMH